MRVMRSLAVFVTASVAAATFAVPGTAFADDTTTTGQVVAAIDNVDAKNGALVADAATSATDADSAAQTATVDISANPTHGVKLTTNGGGSLTIGLPNAKHGGKGTKTRDGAVVYSGRDGSANVVIPTTDGVQFLTTIESRYAPTSYAYPISLPQGGKVGLAVQGGGAVLYDAKGNLSAIVTAPWAKDADGKDVRTWFTTDGKTLTQHVAHKEQGVKYPVVADPNVRWYWNGAVITLTRGDMATVMYGGAQALIPMLLVPGVGWVAVASVLGMAAYASWAYANRQCAWFWLSVPSSWGWYAC